MNLLELQDIILDEISSVTNDNDLLQYFASFVIIYPQIFKIFPELFNIFDPFK